MLPSLLKYLDNVGKKAPASNNFETLKTIINDPTLLAKLGFMQSVAAQVEPYLTAFQADKPILPFMYADLYKLLRSILERFVKESVMSQVKDVPSLLRVEITKENKLETPRIDVGYAAKEALKGLKELDIIHFKRDCGVFLEHMYLKLREKCPLTKKIVKGASCLSPFVMLSSVLRKGRINTALEEFLCKKQLAPGQADLIKRDYLVFCETPSVQKALKEFSRKNDRLDVCLLNILGNEDIERDKELMKKFITKILVVFHGNAAVERSFSINKECLVDNLHEDSLIAQRCVYDAVSTAGGVAGIEVNKSMIHAVRNASAIRKETLKAKKKAEEDESKKRKRLTDELKDLEKKKKRIMETASQEASSLEKDILQLKSKLKPPEFFD